MSKPLEKKCYVIPKMYRDIPDILPKGSRITEAMTLENLNVREIKRCMMNANVYELKSDGTSIRLNELNYFKDNSDCEGDDTI